MTSIMCMVATLACGFFLGLTATHPASGNSSASSRTSDGILMADYPYSGKVILVYSTKLMRCLVYTDAHAKSIGSTTPPSSL